MSVLFVLYQQKAYFGSFHLESMKIRSIILILFALPLTLFSQNNRNKTWEDPMLKSEYVIQYSEEKGKYIFTAEKYERADEFGELVNGSIDQLKLVVSKMDEAFKSKDPEKLFALGRYKYTYHEIIMNDVITVEVLKIEDLLKDDKGKKPVYLLSSDGIESVKAFVADIE